MADFTADVGPPKDSSSDICGKKHSYIPEEEEVNVGMSR